MKLLYLLIVFFCVCSVTLAQPKLKRKIAMAKAAHETEFSLVLTEEYDTQGHLLLREEPLYYCTQRYTYNTKNQLVEEDIMCGESNGNGITRYTYQANKRIGTGEFGAYPFYACEDSFNLQGNKILYRRWQNLLDEDSAYIVEQFFYTPTHRISKKIEHSKWFRKVGQQWDFDFDIKTEKIYTYTAFDSLEQVVFTDLHTKKSIILEKNTYNKKKLLEETRYAYESGQSHKIYAYDKHGNVVFVKMESRKSEKEAWKLDSKTEYSYEKGQVSKETTTSYYNGILNSTITNVYEKGLVQTSKELDRTGKEVEVITYTYLYF